MASVFEKLLQESRNLSIHRLLEPELHEAVAREWRQLTRSSDWCTETVRLRAYRHPNGFVKVTLAADPSGRTVRLHFWNAGYTDSDPHTHRWDLASLVLDGAVENDLFTAEAGEDFEECMTLSPATPSESYVLRPVKRTALSPDTSRV